MVLLLFGAAVVNPLGMGSLAFSIKEGLPMCYAPEHVLDDLVLVS